MANDLELIGISRLARMLNVSRQPGEPEWSRQNVVYWLACISLPTLILPGKPGQFVRPSEAAETCSKLRAARANRRHDGLGGGRRKA